MSNNGWVARYGLTSKKYQQVFDNYAGMGYRLTQVSGYGVGGTAYFAAIWEKTSGPEWIARHNMDAAEYQKYFDQYVSEGYRLTQVSGYGVGDTAYFAAIWEKTSGPEWIARHNMDAAEYQKYFDQYVSEGYRLTQVSGYGVGDTAYFAAIWEKTSGPEWIARHNMDAAEYQKYFDQYVSEGYRLTQVSGYGVGDTAYFAAIWEKTSGPEWIARHNMDAAAFEDYSLTYIGEAYQLVDVSGYDVAGKTMFAALWKKLGWTFPAWGALIEKKIGSLTVGYSYSIAKDGMVTERGGKGWARAPWETSDPSLAMVPGTNMAIASVSKAITAVALLNHLEKSNLHQMLDKPFWEYVPQVTTWGDNVKAVTLRNLLAMRSGMAAPQGSLYGDYWTEMKKWCAEPADPSKIGKDFDYNNNNFCILQAVIQTMTGMSYADYVQQNVFEPVKISGMTDGPVAAGQTLTYATSDLTTHATGKAWPKMTVSTSTGGWVGSVDDLMKFLIGVRDCWLLSAQTTKTMLDNLLGWFQPWWDPALPYRAKNGGLYSGGQGLNTAIVHFDDGYDATIFVNTSAPDNQLWQPKTLTQVHEEITGSSAMRFVDGFPGADLTQMAVPVDGESVTLS